jgi:hypothetical protein
VVVGEWHSMGAKAPPALEVEWRARLIRVLELCCSILSLTQCEFRGGLGMTIETRR